MSTSEKALVIIDGSLHALWKQQIHKKFADSAAFDIVELDPAAPAVQQLQAIYQAHPHPAKSYVFAQKIGAGQEVKLGATTYTGALDLFAAVSPFTNAAGGGQSLSTLNNIDSIFVPGGTSGDDLFQSTAQREVFAGLGGVDAVRFSGSADQYQLSDPNTDTFGATYVTSSGRSAALYDIERLQFSDRHVALDLKDGDSANTALRFLTAIVGESALQNKALVGEAIAYTDAFETGDLAQLLIDAGVLAQFAGGSTDADLVKLLYANIAGQPASAADLQWTLDFAAHSGFTQADILEFAVGLSQNAPEALLMGQPGIDYLPYALF